jgi:hypothetical protein
MISLLLPTVIFASARKVPGFENFSPKPELAQATETTSIDYSLQPVA